MGKLGIGAVTAAAVAVFALVPSREASAQDFGQAWIDRITHELELERGPLEPKPFNLTGTAGVSYQYDNNIFLSPVKTKDSIIIPFVQADLKYGEPRFDVEASLLADYKRYIKEWHNSDDEERFFFRARQTSSRWNFEISEILENVSDPSGLLFVNRVKRLVSTTVPKIAFDIGHSFAIEVSGNVQVVRFQSQPFDAAQDNNNFNVDITAIYRSPWGWDALANFGYYRIMYIDSTNVDCFGYFYRAGFRGNLIERLYFEALAGYETIETDFFPDQTFIRQGTLAGHANLRYELSENMNLFFDAARGYVFWGGGVSGPSDPFQLLDSFSVYFRYDWTETFWIAIRGMFEHAHTALDVSRKWYGASINANYKFTRNIAANLGATFRAGDTDNLGQKVKFTDVIFGGGLAVSF